MCNVAIVGVQGSGKTTLMVSWGWHYFSPDRNGYYLSPDPNGGVITRSFICDKMKRMKEGHFPDATSPDDVKKLNWILGRNKKGRNSKTLGEMSFMDFGGEIYRKAFKDGPDATMALNRDPLKGKDCKPETKAVLQLQWHIRTCRALVILVDLGYIINHPQSDTGAMEMIATIKCMMEIMRQRGLMKCVALAFTQSDLYEETIRKYGSLQNTLGEFLPEIAAHYPTTALFAVSAVNKTKLEDDGRMIPSPDFAAEGLEPLTKWVARQMLRKRRIRILAVTCVMAVFATVLCVSAVVNIEQERKRERRWAEEDRKERVERQLREEAERRRADEKRRELNNIRRIADRVDVCINNAVAEINQNNLSSARTLLEEAEEKINAITGTDENCDWNWVALRRDAVRNLRERMRFIESQRNMTVPQRNFYPFM